MNTVVIVFDAHLAFSLRFDEVGKKKNLFLLVKASSYIDTRKSIIGGERPTERVEVIEIS